MDCTPYMTANSMNVQPANSTNGTQAVIAVTTATYGGNCTGAVMGNETSVVQTACNGQATCNYAVD